MNQSKFLEKVLIVLLLLGIALTGGTARLRPEAAPVMPTPGAVDTRPPAPTENLGQESPPPVTPELDPTPPPTPTPTPEPVRYIMHFVGDCTLASSVYYQGSASGYDTFVNGDFSYPFGATVQYFTDDDFTMANCEVSLTTATKATNKTFTFKADPDYAQIFPAGSVEFVTLANNHVLDYGQTGYDDTKAALDAVGVAYAGRDEWCLYQTEKGMVIGVYAVSFGSLDQIKKGVAAVREAGADFVIAALHFGDEGSYRVNADQRAQAHAAIDAGADFVYGSHAHTLQPTEEYQGKYIYYSMGNWTFGGNTNPRDKDTFILRLTVEQDADGTVRVTEREHIPCASSGRTDLNDYRPVPYEEDSEGWKRVLSKLDGSFTGANLNIGYGYTANE